MISAGDATFGSTWAWAQVKPRSVHSEVVCVIPRSFMNMETAPNFPWMVTADPMPLIPSCSTPAPTPNAIVNNTPRARMREGSPRIVFATALMRAAFAADLELVKLLLDRGADPRIISRDGETMLSAAAGLAFIHGYHRGNHPRSGCRW